jgi:hypothetical protein
MDVEGWDSTQSDAESVAQRTPWGMRSVGGRLSI